MYAGTAAGNSKAHSNIFFPKKLYLVTTHALDIPKIKDKIPTPNISTNVLQTYLGNTVENKCGHNDVSPKKAEKKTAIIGEIIAKANIVANVDELFQLYKITYFIDYHPTLSIIF